MKKKISGPLLSLFVVSMTLSIFAVQMCALSSEPQVLEWDRTYGGVVDDVAWSVVQTNDGGYALAGWTESFGAGAEDFWLIKTDSAGNVQWNQTYGGANGDFTYSVVQTGDGGYALAGWTYSFGAGDADFWLVKVNSSGNMRWNQTYGGTSEEFALSVVQTSDGGYAIIGWTDSFGAGMRDFWLVKTDAFGNMQWNRTYGGANGDFTYSVVQTGDGGYAIAGWTRSFGLGYSDFWLVKTDQAGNLQWNRTYGGTSGDEAYSVIQTGDGRYAIVGSTDSFGAGMRDFWLIKLAPTKIPATIDLDPDTLNLKSKGQWITPYIELPEGYDVNDIDVTAVMLNDTIPVDLDAPTEIGDYDNDGIPDLMVKFDRAEIVAYIRNNLGGSTTATLTIFGKLYDGTPFQGSDTIRILVPHPNGKGKVFDS